MRLASLIHGGEIRLGDVSSDATEVTLLDRDLGSVGEVIVQGLRLDPDDVEKFLGHRSGVQVWEMYVRVRPDLFGRAGEASKAAGDPRM